ncbi:serine/threonine-protein phosphatase [Streptomyces sp. NBC_00057]
MDTGRPRPDRQDVLPPEATFLLYTDGLIERPGDSVANRLRRLREEAAALAREPLSTFCDEVLTGFGNGSTDDIALLAVRLPTHPSGRQDPL